MTETPTVLAEADGVRRLPSAMPTPTLDVVVPVYNEEADLGRCRAPAARVSRRESVPFSARITIADNASTDATLARSRGRLAAETRRRRVRAPRREGSRPRTAHRVGRLGRDGRRLHGRGPVHRSQRAAAAGRAAGVRALRPRDRLPALALVAGGPRTQARVHLPLLQPDPANVAARAVLRRPVRVQGDAHRRRARNCCRWSRTPNGSSTPNCWCSPNARACASTRCRSTGSTTRTAASTSSTTARKDLSGIWRVGRALVSRLAAGRQPAEPLGREPLVPGVPRGMVGQLVRFGVVGVVSHRRLRAALPDLRTPRSARRPRTSSHCCVTAMLQHRRQPRVHLRGARLGGRRPAPVPGPVDLRFGLLLTSGSLLVLHAPAARRVHAQHRTRRPRARQSRCHPRADSSRFAGCSAHTTTRR